MKLDENLLQVNLNMIELKGKKVLIQPSQAKSTKGKEDVIGEERAEDDQAKKVENWSMKEEREK
jgi:hypothetical protein